MNQIQAACLALLAASATHPKTAPNAAQGTTSSTPAASHATPAV